MKKLVDRCAYPNCFYIDTRKVWCTSRFANNLTPNEHRHTEERVWSSNYTVEIQWLDGCWIEYWKNFLPTPWNEEALLLWLDTTCGMAEDSKLQQTIIPKVHKPCLCGGTYNFYTTKTSILHHWLQSILPWYAFSHVRESIVQAEAKTSWTLAITWRCRSYNGTTSCELFLFRKYMLWYPDSYICW